MLADHTFHGTQLRRSLAPGSAPQIDGDPLRHRPIDEHFPSKWIDRIDHSPLQLGKETLGHTLGQPLRGFMPVQPRQGAGPAIAQAPEPRDPLLP